MTNPNENQLILQAGINAAKAGKQEEARKYLQEAVRRDTNSEPAWLWLSSVAKDARERVFCLNQVLRINPNNEFASKAMMQMGGGPNARVSEPSRPIPEIPFPDDKKLSASMTQLEPIILSYRPLPEANIAIQWGKKTGGRTGEAVEGRLRIAIIAGVAVVGLIILVLGISFVSNLGGPQYVVVGYPATVSPTPTQSDTPTPFASYTPSPTLAQTLTPSSTPRFEGGASSLNKGGTPIPGYPEAGNNTKSKEAQHLFEIGSYDKALTILDDQRKALELSKDRDYYSIIYYMVLIYDAQGNPDRAMSLLQDNQDPSQALYRAALGYTYYVRGEIDNAIQELTVAQRSDPRLTLVASTLAKAYVQKAQYADARRALNVSLDRAPQDTTLINARAAINLAAGNLGEALNDAQLVLYIDPTNREAYSVQNKVLIAQAEAESDPQARQQKYGTAVLAAQEFLRVYPGETSAWLALGQAREGEGNTTSALDAYNQAVVVDKTSDAALEVFIARARLLYSEQRYQEAEDAIAAADSIRKSTAARDLRLNIALSLGNYLEALNIADEILQAEPTNTALITQKLGFLVRAFSAEKVGKEEFEAESAQVTDEFIAALQPEDQSIARLYRGIVRFNAGKDQDALADINASLALKGSGIGRYYRAQILEQLGQIQLAVLDYEWLSYWNDLYNFPFNSTVQASLSRIQALLPTQTSTPTNTPTQTSTFTPTPTYTRTATRTPLPTKTAIPTKTLAPTRTPVPSKTPVPTRTPVPSKTPRVTATSASQ